MRLNTLIFFITSRCNARCGTCFYWQELNQRGDLTFEEIDRLSTTMPRFKELWLSGGEPMMRPRLAEIIKMFYDRNGVRTLNLPSNGLFKDRLLELTEFCSRELPELKVNLNLALDGFQETHDRIRGVPGNFDKTVDAITALYPVRDHNRNIRLHVNSVITSTNIDELERLGWWLIEHLDLNGQYFQVIRGDPMDAGLKGLTRERLAGFYHALKPIHEHYGRKLSAKHGGGVKGWLNEFFYTQTIFFHYTVQEQNYERSNPWPMPCMAGQTILVIDYNGDVRACELRNKVANLRDVDCDFRHIYPSDVVQRETEQIVKDQCWCTHICFIHDSLKSSPRAQAYDIPLGRKVTARRPTVAQS
jgi:MoaA/NifB/PqqE/SkfB family radical SAM enzyme